MYVIFIFVLIIISFISYRYGRQTILEENRPETLVAFSKKKLVEVKKETEDLKLHLSNLKTELDNFKKTLNSCNINETN